MLHFRRMFSLYLVLFVSGLLTILLPCILPLVPIAVGASLTDRHPLRPLVVALGMVVGFAGSAILLQLLLANAPTAANAVRYATEYVLLLFGLGFVSERRSVHRAGAIIGAVFFLRLGWVGVLVAAACGVVLMEVGGRIAARLQRIGGEVQGGAQTAFGRNSLVTAFLLGLTMGLIWVPCAGPALAFALSLVRNAPVGQAVAALTIYAVGAAVPLLLIGYGGRYVLERARFLTRFSGKVKHVAGVIFLLTAVALHYNALTQLQACLGTGSFASQIEDRLFRAVSGSSASGAELKPMPPSPAIMGLPVLPKLSRAPMFAGLGPWHNSEPLSMDQLRGKVVLVDFWTYSCINCIRTLPYIQGYAQKFKDDKFVIIGVHTPEFVFERDEKNVEMAIKKYGLTYPVAQDNDFGTWNAFSNHYWPAKYLIDVDGYIRYEHFGEGGYDETDKAIQSLLAEAGEAPKGSVTESPATPRRATSAETYLHSRSWPAFGNGTGSPTAAVQTYAAPDSMELHRYYLDGRWQLVDDERQVLRSDNGEIRMRWLGGEINLVMGLEDGTTSATGEVWIDGKKVKTITVTSHDLYNLFTGEYGEHELVLKLVGKGVSGYAFTFGAGR